MISTTDILNGTYDSALDQIAAACHERRKLLRNAKAAVTMATVQVGTMVRLKGLRPKYINGVRAKVVGKRRTKLSVCLDESRQRYLRGMTIIVPSSCVEVE